MRLSPENRLDSMSGSNALAHFTDFAEQLGRQELAYLYVREGDMMTKTASLDYAALRAKFGGTYIANNGYDLQRAQGAVRAGAADLIAFGLPFLANPDLVRRFNQKLSLNVDPTAFYGGDEAGYTDYPFYNAEATAAA